MLARAEEIASPSSVLETEALLLNYALMKQWSGSRESNSRHRFGRPQPRHSARPASNLVGALGLAPRRSHGRRFYGPLQSLLCQTPKNFGTSLTNRTPFIAVRSRNAGSTGRGVEMLAPFPRNPTWSSLAYKASAVASGSKGAFVSSLRFFASG